MDTQKLINNVGRFCKKNLPYFFAGGTTLGILGSNILMYYEAPISKENVEALPSDDPKLDKIWEGVKPILPAIGFALAGTACAWIGAKDAMDSLDAAQDTINALAEYYTSFRDAVVATSGTAAVSAAMSHQAKEDLPKDLSKIELNSEGEQLVWFYDKFASQILKKPIYFKKSWRDVLMAQTNLNEIFQVSGFVSLYEWYNQLGLTDISKEFGDKDYGWEYQILQDACDVTYIPMAYWDIDLDNGEKGHSIEYFYPPYTTEEAVETAKELGWDDLDISFIQGHE